MTVTLPLVGEPLALDLVNTLARGPEGDVDLLASAAEFRSWLEAQSGRLPTTPEAVEIDLPALRALRTQVTEAVERVREGLPPLPAARAALVEAQLAAPAHRSLDWDGAELAARRVRTGGATEVLLAELAEAAVELLSDPASVQRIRRCEGPDCRLLFVAVNPRRRWCSAAACGNRVRVARYYQRHRGTV